MVTHTEGYEQKKQEFNELYFDNLRNNKLPYWFIDLTKTVLSRNVTLEDWNCLCKLLKNITVQTQTFQDLLIEMYNSRDEALTEWLEGVYNEVNGIVTEGMASHINNTENPHQVTKEQLGVKTLDEIELEAILDWN